MCYDIEHRLQQFTIICNLSYDYLSILLVLSPTIHSQLYSFLWLLKYFTTFIMVFWWCECTHSFWFSILLGRLLFFSLFVEFCTFRQIWMYCPWLCSHNMFQLIYFLEFLYSYSCFVSYEIQYYSNLNYFT